MSGLKFSAKELQRIVAQPDYAIANGDSKPQKRQDLSKLLPEGSKHEVKFIRLWSELQGPALVREYRFCDRKWRFDFCHVFTKIAIEVEGFGHQRANRFASDIQKYNTAALMGFKVYRMTGKMINVLELQKIIDFIRMKEAK